MRIKFTASGNIDGASAEHLKPGDTLDQNRAKTFIETELNFEFGNIQIEEVTVVEDIKDENSPTDSPNDGGASGDPVKEAREQQGSGTDPHVGPAGQDPAELPEGGEGVVDDADEADLEPEEKPETAEPRDGGISA